MSDKVTLIIPVRRDADKLERSLRSVLSGTLVPRIIVMDCTADPEILGKTREKFPGVRFFDLGMNPGRAHAVNTGFHITQTPYVMTLSPGLVAGKHCVEKLCAALDNDPDLLSAQAKILTAEEPPRISGAGWLLDLSAEPVIRGAGRSAASCSRKTGITATQMDAAIYRMEYLEVTGILDERFYTRMYVSLQPNAGRWRALRRTVSMSSLRQEIWSISGTNTGSRASGCRRARIRRKTRSGRQLWREAGCSASRRK